MGDAVFDPAIEAAGIARFAAEAWTRRIASRTFAAFEPSPPGLDGSGGAE
jgi:hypothetical protein